MIRKAGIAIAALAAAGSSTALAQTTDTDIDRAEARLDRPERPERARARASLVEAAEAPKHWTLSFSLPFTFNTNVASAETNTSQAFHADPTIALEGAWPLGGGATFFFETSADADIYTRHAENDGASLYGRAGFRFGNAKERIAPYLHYTFIGLYAGQFEDHDVSTHYFTLGAKRTFLIGGGRSFTIDANVLRREATIREVEQNRATLVATYGQELSDATSWSLGARTQIARYTGGTADGRDDLTVRLSAGISHRLSPPDTLPELTFDAGIYFQRNWSDRAGKDYSVWDVGPTLALSTQF